MSRRDLKLIMIVIIVLILNIFHKFNRMMTYKTRCADSPFQRNQMGYEQDNIGKRTSSIEEVEKGKQKSYDEADDDYVTKDDQNRERTPSTEESQKGEQKSNDEADNDYVKKDDHNRERTPSTEELQKGKQKHDDKVDGDSKKDDIGKTPIESRSKVDILPFAGIPSRFWTCQRDSADKEQKKRKLFFVHVYKTAGTTFRQFFRNYAHICNRIALTIRCSSVLSESLTNQTSKWMLKASKSSRGPGYSAGPCVAGDFVDGESNVSARKKITSPEAIERYNQRQDNRLFNNITYEKLQKYGVDILSGHTPIGLHSNWYTEKGKVVTPLYITFFRDPIDRFVSGQLQANKQEFHVGKEEMWDFKAALAYIVEEIKNKKTRRDILGYLTTPAQKELKNITLAEKQNLVKSNLVDFPVIVGVVERMADSLNLIRYAINSDGNALVDKMIDSLDYETSQNKTNGSRRRLLEKNKSKISTSALVREIKKDTKLFTILKSSLRREYELYDFAIEVHKQQVERLSKIIA